MEVVVAKTGKFLYGNSTEVKIRIVQRNFRPGTGDEEDDPEYRDDQPGIWFEIEYGSVIDPNRYSTGGGYFRSIEEALKAAEKKVHLIEWE